MKKITLLLLVFVTAIAIETSAQATVNAETCLLSEFNQSELDAMSADEMAYQRYVIENAVHVYDIPEDKPTDIYPHKKWTINSDVCIYDMKVKIKAEERVNFISSNNMLVMIFSENELKQNFDRYNQ
jgi:hypothetical protein